jgi:hypothetical protein
MAKHTDGDRNGFGVGTLVLMLMALVIAFAALVVAGQALSRANDAKHVAETAGVGTFPSKGTVTLEEFQIIASPTQYKAGKVTLTVKNIGTMTHEMVLFRAANADALPKVTTAGGDRAVGDVDEEAIPKADAMGETGDVKPGKTVVKTFDLTPGSYVMICNIDDPQPDGTVVSHFQRGMHTSIDVVQ